MLSILLAFSQFFSPFSLVSDMGLPTVAAMEWDRREQLREQLAMTQQIVSRYSKANPDVTETSNAFLTHLYQTYCRGEGMIDKDILLVLAAVKFAAEKHRFQTRKDPKQTPYIIHPIGVADHLLTIGKVHDPDILIAALLHDTVEDTDTKFEEIHAIFGTRVEGFVRELTDDKALPKMERKRLQIEHASAKSAGAAQIKLADKYYNLNDLLQMPPPDWDKERIKAYFKWARQVVDALPWVNSALKTAVDETIALLAD